MPQIFHRSANAIARITIFGSVVLIALVGYAATEFFRSPYFTRTKTARDQPVPFSHEHHAAQLGIDCRYCHTSVERSSVAGVPPTKTCMNCHSQLWTNAPMLEPVRESYRSDRSLEWNRVHDLPDFVYFNHSIHVSKGIGCETCHGRMDKMQLTSQDKDLYMKWCLDCHRAPEKFIRPREAVFQFDWSPPGGDQLALGRQLVKAYNVKTSADCSTCHR